MTSASPGFHALRFGRSAAGYEEQADVQARMAEALLSLWGERAAPARILEFGCGTGLLTRRLRARFPDARHLATDAAPEMLSLARRILADGGSHEDGGRVKADVKAGMTTEVTTEVKAQPGPADRTLAAPRFSVLDARGDGASYAALTALAVAHADVFPVDLVAAGALVQWFPDLGAHLRCAASFAAPGAAYLVSGFDRDNFPELNTLLAEPPFSYEDFPGHAPSTLEEAATAAGWSVSGLLTWEEREVLPGARAVLTRMRDLGAVRDPRSGGRMTRAGLAHLLNEYERRFAVAPAEGGQPVSVSMTWKPWVALLNRR